jgi:hypothetical protein
MQKLDLPAQAPGPDPRPLWKGREREPMTGDQDIIRGLASKDGADHEARRKIGRQVLEAVHREIDPILEEGFFDLLDEQPLPAGARQRGVEDPIPRGPDRDDRDLQPRPPGRQFGRDEVGLSKGQSAPSRAEPYPLLLSASTSA